MPDNCILVKENLDLDCPKRIVYHCVLVQSGYSNSHLVSISHSVSKERVAPKEQISRNSGTRFITYYSPKNKRYRLEI